MRFNEVAEGDLGGETSKVSEPLNSCYIRLSQKDQAKVQRFLRGKNWRRVVGTVVKKWRSVGYCNYSTDTRFLKN